jgi:hypothetical protein
MKSTISIVSFFAFIFVSTTSVAQYKYDIGLRASTYDMERFQLEARFHLDNPYSITAALISGSSGSGSSYISPVYGDSLYFVNQSSSHMNNIGLKVGVQRKLGFLASNMFYAGATVGFGYEKHSSSNYTATHAYFEDTLISNPGPYFFWYWDEIESEQTHSRTSAINAQLGLSFGMDVPLSKRFSVNAQLGLTALYQNNLDYNYSIITLQGTVSGGLRYSFGKR